MPNLVNKRKFRKYPFQIHENRTPNLPIFTKKCVLHFLLSRAIKLNFCLNETKNGKKQHMVKKSSVQTWTKVLGTLNGRHTRQD